MYSKKKHKEKNDFCMNCLQCFSSEEILTNLKKGCLKIDAKQSVTTPKKGSNVQIKISCMQLQAPFIIDTDFESNVKKIQKPSRDNADASYTEKYIKSVLLVVMVTKLYVLMIDLANPFNSVYRFIKRCSKKVNIVKKSWKNTL